MRSQRDLEPKSWKFSSGNFLNFFRLGRVEYPFTENHGNFWKFPKEGQNTLQETMEISDKKFPVWYRMIVSSQPYVSRNYHVEVAHSVPIFFVSSQPYAKVHMFPGTTTGRWLTQFPYFFCVFIFLIFFCIFHFFNFYFFLFFSWLYPLDKHKNSVISQKLIEILEQD